MKYIPGKEDIADTLSRLVLKTEVTPRNVAEEYVRNVAVHMTPIVVPIKEVKREFRYCIQSSEFPSVSSQNGTFGIMCYWKIGVTRSKNRSSVQVKEASS